MAKKTCRAEALFIALLHHQLIGDDFGFELALLGAGKTREWFQNELTRSGYEFL